MQIVISIDENLYTRLFDNGDIDAVDMLNACVAIRKGTILPKGHGRLKDIDELLNMTESYKSELGRLKADPFVKCGIETVENFIEDILTIIEADKEGEND